MKTLRLSNSRTERVLISDEVYGHLLSKFPQEWKIIENFRLHSAGYAFFQKNFYKKEYSGDTKIERNVTIYMHKLACKLHHGTILSKPKMFVHIIDGDKLNCLPENLEWMTMGDLRRTQKSSNKSGYRGVVKLRPGKHKQRYRAVAYKDGVRYNMGIFDSPHSAADAYNQKIIELYGNDAESFRLNEIPAKHATT